MAFASIGSIGTGTRTAAGTTTTITTSALANASDLVVVWIAKDNTSTTDGATSEVTNCTDSAGNQYVKAGEYTNSAGSANSGATVALWYCKLTSNLASSGTITVTHDSVTDVAISAWRFTMTSILRLASSATPVVSDTTAHGTSIALSGLPSKEYLFVRATAIEDEVLTTDTATASYTASDHLASTTAGAATGNIFLAGEFRILTGTGSTSAPTYTGATTQSATIFVAFDEVAGGGLFMAGSYYKVP